MVDSHAPCHPPGVMRTHSCSYIDCREVSEADIEGDGGDAVAAADRCSR